MAGIARSVGVAGSGQRARDDAARPEPAAVPRASPTTDLYAEIRNAEMAIRGFVDLADEELISPAEALRSIEEALVILGRARALAERTEKKARRRA